MMMIITAAFTVFAQILLLLARARALQTTENGVEDGCASFLLLFSAWWK